MRMTERAWFLGSDLAGVVTAMITPEGRARAPIRLLSARHPPPHQCHEDFADTLSAAKIGANLDSVFLSIRYAAPQSSPLAPSITGVSGHSPSFHLLRTSPATSTTLMQQTGTLVLAEFGKAARIVHA